jgi:hypothetical protein
MSAHMYEQEGTDFVLRLFNAKSEIQVSLAFRGGYVPSKLQTVNTKTGILGLI